MSDATTPPSADKVVPPAGMESPTPAMEQPPPLAHAGRPDAPPAPAGSVRPSGGFLRRFVQLRKESAFWEVPVFGSLCMLLVLGLWWFVTSGPTREERIYSPTVLPSPAETFRSFHELWFERELTRNTYASLRRVTSGFGLAALIGVPVGILAGCYSWFNAFLTPLTIFGRNIPVAALIPLTFSFFGIGEEQKIMFIFIASVAFIMSDSARAVMDVDQRYIDTAYTLGAGRRQVILKVLVPLSLPDILNSLRLLFGLAFGYIMLAELVKFGNESGGLGDIINTSQKRGMREHIILVLLIIPLVAMGIDRVLFWIQRELFPHRYGGAGLLNSAVRGLLAGWERVKGIVFPTVAAPAALPRLKAERSKP